MQRVLLKVIQDLRHPFKAEIIRVQVLQITPVIQHQGLYQKVLVVQTTRHPEQRPAMQAHTVRTLLI
jgi:hypothetical protein